MFNEHQTDLLKLMYSAVRELQLKGIPAQPYDISLEMAFAHSSEERLQRWYADRDQLAAEGLINILSQCHLELTLQGREIAKRMFDEMLKRDGYTEHDYFTKDIL